MVIKTIIVDDEEIWRELAQSYLTVNEEVKIVAQCTSAKEALKILTEKEVDMMLLDVQMQDISGISLAKSLKKPPHIVLMTSHPEFAVDGFDIEAVDFMVKPFTFERLMMAVERVKKRVVLEKEATNSEEVRFSEKDNFFFVRTQGSYVKIFFNDILYIKAMENFIQIVTPSQKHTVLMPLTTVEGKLPTQFFRIHRSYIVNSDNIQSIERDIVNLGGDNSAPMSELYKDALIGQIVEGKVLKK